jgi:SpoVK/Ycf46/Vps4 family AAA+-type ATPase
MTGLVGGSESRMREAIKQAEAMAPAILWIDEVEKAMSGVKSSNFSDAGTMSRVFGTFLTWMQEKTADIIVIATANDITQVPPEFIRRFNEVFFVDIPLDDEQKEIFNIHLQKRGRDPAKFNVENLVKNCPNYTGAEIEKSVTHAIAAAFQRGAKEVEDADILRALAETKPIYQVMGEKIKAIRQWARNRARYASAAAEEAAGVYKQKIKTEGGQTVDLDKDLGELDDVVKKSGANDGKDEDLVI